ncbi:hypothetical protein FNV58_01110 (plasmid) [Streptomyces sp. RLB1-9]|uniref:hypothetical protein n=1 Tax=Streptomyces sp. RLB1-9 TaxID=2594454 RepID=UPI001163C989|nr:hypothetical protein [Streptomyces sp. RLB1-9]QDN94960.1 hypothetical protein FNV58_01110 [Streptomyces sp. RLB1-9]
MDTPPECLEMISTHGAIVQCEKHAAHSARRMPSWRWHEGQGGVRWPAAPRDSFLANDGPRWNRPDSGFDVIGRLDEPGIPDGPTVRAMLLATALCAGADLDGTPESWGTAAALRARFETGTPRLSYDETLAFADLARVYAIPDHRQTVLRALGYLSAVNGLPRTTCRGLDDNGDKCGRSNHHRGDCRH